MTEDQLFQEGRLNNKIDAKFEIAEGYESPFKDHKIILPRRETKYSAGYDLRIIESGRIMSGDKRIIRTGITIKLPNIFLAKIYIRSSLGGFKADLELTNKVAIIDSDYYPKEIKLSIRNNGNKPFYYYSRDKLAQVILQPYFLTANDEPVDYEREEGTGSTGRR